MTKHSLFRYFKTSLEIIRLAVMMYVRFPLLLRNVEDLLHERGIPVFAETGSNLSDTTMPGNLVKSSIHTMGFSE
jgi:transposase-like protein